MAASPSTGPRPLRLLIVEPDDRCDEVIRQSLGRGAEVFRVERVTSMAEALEQVSRARYDCALIEYELPDGTALDFLQATGVAERVPVIVMTENRRDSIAALQALQWGASDYLFRNELPAGNLVRAIRYAVERQRLTELRTRLFHAERFTAIGQLAAGIAHGINNPSAALVTYLSMLAEDVASIREQLVGAMADPETGGAVQKLVTEHGTFELLDEMGEFTRESQEASRRITEMVSYLSAFARGQRDEPETLRLSEIARVATRLAQDFMQGIHIDEEIAETAEIVGHRARLCGLAVALMRNAAQALTGTPADERRVVVRTRDDGDEVVLEVEDNGEGMLPNDVERAFEPFYTTRRERGQVGLGLTVCRDVVARHDGEIEIFSERGKGTRVEVRLPLETGLAAEPTRETRAPHKPARAPTPEPTPRVRLLLIDDDAQVRQAIERLLRRSHDVVQADGGASGLAVLEDDREFGAVICDLVMPEVDGPAVYRAVCERWPDVADRFIFLTGAAIGEEKMAFVDRADTPVLHKPVAPEELLATIDEVARRR